MATGIVGVLTSAGSISYTPQCAAKVLVGGYGGNVQLNGAIINGGTNAPFSQTVYVGAGQTLTVVTSTGNYVIMSSLEAA